jgi:gamma-glutamylaminecyclotransferase
MCVIIIKDGSNIIDDATLAASATINPHGLGIAWLDTGEVEKTTSDDWAQLRTERPYIAHFRYATIGKVSPANCHPFEINDEEVLFQNGTVHNLGYTNMTDTEHLAYLLHDIPKDLWEDVLEMTDCRFTTFNRKTKDYELYNIDMWEYSNEVMYSKKNVLGYNLVAVYGTLKKGNSNYYSYANDLKFVGHGKTVDKYPLIVNGLPYLLPKKDVGHNVKIDLFLADDATLKDLDVLEGHPTWYKREQVPIQLENGIIVNAWVYFNIQEKDTGVHHESFEQNYKPMSYYSGLGTKKYDSDSYSRYYRDYDDPYDWGYPRYNKTKDNSLFEVIGYNDNDEAEVEYIEDTDELGADCPYCGEPDTIIDLESNCGMCQSCDMYFELFDEDTI